MQRKEGHGMTETQSQTHLDLEHLSAAGSITGLDVSPDGERVCFGSTAGGVSQVYVLDLTSGDVRRLTDDQERSAQPLWSPTGEQIAFLRDLGGDENYGVYVVAATGGTARDVTGAPGNLHENHAWSKDGRRICYVSNRDGQFDVYFSDVDTGAVHRVTHHPAVHHNPQFSPDGRLIAFASNRSDMPANWDTFVVDLEGGEERRITQHEGEADEMSYYAGQAPYFSPDGRRVLVASSVPGNYDIMAVDLTSGEREWLVQSWWDESNAQWSPEGTRLAYVVNEDTNLLLSVKNLTDGRSWVVSQHEGVSGMTGMRGKGGSYVWTPGGTHLIYAYSGPDEAGSLWMVSAEGGEPRLLYSTLPQEVARSRLAHPEVVHYPSFDGRAISALLYRPQGEGPFPTVIMPHGGPTGQSLNSWNPTAQYLVSRGFALMEPNFRGSTGYGREFQWLNRYDWGGGDLRDVMAGADWLMENGIASSLGIAGGSYGGYMVMNAITQYPERWKAAVALVPMVDLVGSYRSAREDMRQFQVRNMGTPDERPDLYRDRSPINFVERVQAPLLILAGERDPRCGLAEINAMRDRLEGAGKTFEFVVYPHEGHGFQGRENRLDSVRRMGDFFSRHMG